MKHKRQLSLREFTPSSSQQTGLSTAGSSLAATMMRAKISSPAPDDLSSEVLRQQARWIRDILDPKVARDGAEALKADEVLSLDDFLRRLLSYTTLSVDDLRYSRMHLAVSEIAGRATRWPTRLIARCDALIEEWEAKFGGLKELGTPLYEPGGRLWGVSRPGDLSREKLLVSWLKSPSVKVSPAMARKVGGLGFKPGDWWINPMFAFREGIIDCGDPDGGITADSQGAYAIVMTDHDEMQAPTPHLFTYRARPHDKGRYRLTAATVESRQPIRILRNHSLRSFWSPSCGVRFDGLHKVVSWSIKLDPSTKSMVYDITFQRLPMQVGMDTVLARPMAEEAEDYREYKRIRKQMRDNLMPKLLPSATALLNMDGVSGERGMRAMGPVVEECDSDSSVDSEEVLPDERRDI